MSIYFKDGTVNFDIIGMKTLQNIVRMQPPLFSGYTKYNKEKLIKELKKLPKNRVAEKINIYIKKYGIIQPVDPTKNSYKIKKDVNPKEDKNPKEDENPKEISIYFNMNIEEIRKLCKKRNIDTFISSRPIKKDILIDELNKYDNENTEENDEIDIENSKIENTQNIDYESMKVPELRKLGRARKIKECMGEHHMRKELIIKLLRKYDNPNSEDNTEEFEPSEEEQLVEEDNEEIQEESIPETTEIIEDIKKKVETIKKTDPNFSVGLNLLQIRGNNGDVESVKRLINAFKFDPSQVEECYGNLVELRENLSKTIEILNEKYVFE